MNTTISSAKNIIKKTVRKQMENNKLHIPIFLHSSPGIGKSAATRQAADELTAEYGKDIGFIDVRLAQMEQSDVAGIPYVSHSEDNREMMKNSIPEWFPSDERVKKGDFPEKGILFTDELSNAPIPVQHAAYRMILDRELNYSTKLADGWVIVAAGNLKSDKTGAKGVAPALANRFGIHLEIRSDLDDFHAYALSSGMHHEVIGYVSYNPANLYSFDPAKHDVAFATPRSWEQVSNLLSIDFNAEETALALSGCVGEAVSHDFMSFRKYYEHLPNWVDVMDGKTKYDVPSDRGVVFAVTSSLIVNLVHNASNEKRIKNLNKVLMQLDDDFLVMVYKTLKNGASDEDITSILLNTMETYKRVSKYTRMGEVD